MPQFDQFSFLNQVSWFLFLFFNFYFLISYFFLPTICYNLKFRKKKIIFNIKRKNQINLEKNNRIFFFNNSYKKFFSKFEFFFNKKLTIHKENEKTQILKTPFFNFLLKTKIHFLLNKKFLLLNKIFLIN